jgi:glutathione S-transferase
MYTLYYSPSAASFAVHWMLNEVKTPHELVLVDLKSKQQKSESYLKLNPSGMVPTLIVDGAPRTECAALLMLLAERHSQADLAPLQGTPARADYLQWMFFFANTLQPAYRAWFYAHEPAGEASIDAVKAQARTQIEAIWIRVDTHLSNRAYIAGDKLSAVDFLATMLMRWSRNMPKPATEWTNINTYVRRMRAMPSYIQTLQMEKLSDWVNLEQ